ncbi:MAG: putative Ig domain-containing protein [Myxococcota bacterium]|nr:putative Ig domain-containing protein [Myxococcota bacterium]
MTTPIPDASAPTGSGPQDIDLDVHFDDDQGVGNLTYTIVDVSNPAFGASIVGSTLTITFPGTPATGTITVRATDADGRFVEQTFNVTAAASTPPTVIATIPDQSVAPGAPPRDIGLEAYFDDDQGVGNLTFSVEAISNPAFGASVLGSTLTLTFPAVPEVGTITVRATDPDLQFVEQVFSVTTSDPVVLYRVNAGGPAVAAIDGGIDWEEDTQSLNSQYLTDPGNNKTSSHNVGAYDVSVDLATTPTDLFLTERWDRPTGTNVVYGFPVGAGDYEVRLYLANGFNGTSEPGERIFDILLEGQTTPQLTDIDLSAQFGHQVGAVIVEQLTVNDGLLEIELVHGPIQNPIINGIEILSGGSASVAIDVVPVPDQSSLEGDLINLPVIASGGDTGTFSFSATSLPTGLQIEPTTGLIFGTVATGAAAGSPYLVTITVDDDDADPTDTVDEILTWIVEEPTPTPISVTPIPDQQSSEGGLVSLQVVASGGDTGSFGFQASGLPAGLSIGASTGLISGTIALGAATGSPYVVSVTVDDEDGDATDTVTEVFTWTVDAPTPIDVTPVPDQQSIEGEIVSLQVVASGGDTGSLTYQATNLPAGLSIGTSTGLISGTVAAGASASSPYAVSITVDDGDGDATDVVTELLTWTVNAPTPISVSPVADQLSTEGDVVSLQVVASGGDTGSLDYQASGLPAGLSIGSSTGLITGTIAAGASTSSPYAVSVTVDDGDGDATDAVTENFSWTVNPPAGTTPIDVVPVADQSSTEGDVISLQVVASGGDTGTFDFQATGLPPGLSIAQATGLITGTISAGASTGSPYAVSIDVDDNDADGTDVVTRAFSWTVDAPSTPISVTPIADQSSTEGDAISLQVVASGGDTGTFDFQASGLPTGLSIDATTGLISGTIATGASASSPFAVSITVDDEDGDATDTVTELFSWTVSPAAPQGEALYRVNAGGPAVAAIDGGIDWEEDTKTQNSLHLLDNGNNKTSSHQVGAYDVSVDLATTPTDIFLTERWDRPPGTNVIYGFPVVAGDYEVRLYLANGFNGTSEPGERVFDIEIEGQAFPQLTDIDLSAQFGHRVGGVIVQPITVTDGLLEIELFHGPVENPIVNGIEILPASEPPPLAVDPVADQVSPEGAIVSLAVVASGGDTGSFDFQASGLPSGLSIAPTTGLITGTIALGATAGSPYSVSVSVDDNDADPTDVVTANFSWTVDPQTPINVTPVPDQQTTEGGSVSVQVVASGGDTGSLTFQASGLPAGLSIGSSTGLISGTVSAGAAASSPYSVSITVDDGDGDATDGVTENFTWTVDEPVATPISVDPVPDQQSTEGDPVSLQVVASGGDTGTFDFQATGLPGGLSIGSSTGLISGTVAAGASTSSPYAVSITVDDNDGDATDVVIETFTWTVDAPSTPIDVTPVADQASTEGDAISLQVVASGGDTGTFDFQATGLPTGLSIGASTGLISGTVSAGASAGSPYSVSITVDDNDGDATDTVVEAFSWTVVPDSGGSPQLSIADATVAEDGGSAVFVVSLSQAAASDVSFSFATSNGTAGTKWNRQDYQATSGSDSILAGQLSTTIEIPIFDDIAIEGDETFNVTLSNVSGAVLLDGTAVGTIDEDDGENLSANLVRFDLSSGGNPFDPSSFDIRPSFSFADGPSGLSLVVTGREVLVDAAGQETTTVIAVDVTQTGFGLGVAGVSDLAGTNIIFANQVDGKGIDGTNDGTGDYEELVITVSGAPSVQLETVTFGNGNSDDDFTIDVGGVELVSRITATDPGNLPHDVTSFGVVGNEIVFGVFSNTSSDDYAVKVIEVSVP